MHYDADAYLDGLKEPTYTHHKCVYYGRHLSFDQWVALTHHMDVLARVLRAAASMDELSAARAYVQFRVSMRRIVDAVFPRGCRVDRPDGVPVPRRGWLITRPARVSELLEELPLEAQTDAVRGFIRSLEKRNSATATPGETTIPTPPPPETGSETTPTTPEATTTTP